MGIVPRIALGFAMTMAGCGSSQPPASVDDPVRCGTAAECFERGDALESRSTSLDPVATRVKYAQAGAYYRAACEKRHAEGCHRLAAILWIGAGVPPDLPRAADLLERACHLGQAQACAELADMHAAGWGVTSDRARAQVLYRQACDQGVSDACARAEHFD